MMGSVAWGELNAELLNRSYAYLNVDTAVGGTKFSAGGSFSLRDAIHDVLNMVDGPNGDPIALGWSIDNFFVLGSGSDYTVFYDHFGVASLDFDYTSGAGSYGVYHSIYDSFDWVDKVGVGAPGVAFELMQSTAKVWGMLALRLADLDRVPFNHSRQADALKSWTKTLPDGVDLSSILAAVKEYSMAARAAAHEAPSRELNDRLAYAERGFLSEKGLPKRKWFKNTLAAPGYALGYAGVALPGPREALEDGNVTLAMEQVEELAAAVSSRTDSPGRVRCGLMMC